jgi:hypothetical protein
MFVIGAECGMSRCTDLLDGQEMPGAAQTATGALIDSFFVPRSF